MAKVIVTGATGFVGVSLVSELLKDGHELISLERRKRQNPPDGLTCIVPEEWSEAALANLLKGAETVIHLASRNHHVGDDAQRSADLYRTQIFDLSCTVAKAAAAAKIKLFVYLSTIKVRELESSSQNNDLALQQPYGFYKQQTEIALSRLAVESDMKIAILRPPLVYDLSAKGNFGTMVKLVKTGFPLPVPGQSAQRSLVSRDNLVACLAHIVKKKDELSKGCRIMEVCDGKTYRIDEQLRGIAAALNSDIRLFRLPRWILTVAFAALGKKSLLENMETELKLTNDLITAYCGWRPEHSWLSR